MRAKRRVNLRISEFCLEALAGDEGEGTEHVPSRLQQALRLYLRDRGSGRPGSGPSVLRSDGEGGDVELELSVDEDLWRELEEETGRQGVSTSRMAAHAALYYAGELSAGRVAERVLEGLEDDGAREG